MELCRQDVVNGSEQGAEAHQDKGARMRLMKRAITLIAIGGGLLAFSAASAFASVSLPVGTPANGNTVPFVLDGIYTDPTELGTQPFASAAFTLEVNLPTNVFISNPSPSTPESFFIAGGISGSYSDGGQTENFTNGDLQVNQFDDAGGLPVTQLQVDAFNILSPPDELFLYPTLAGILYTFSADSTMAGTKTGLYVVPQGEAYYNQFGDPPFTGAAQVGNAVSAAPEPSSWLLFIFGVGGIGLMLRRKKREGGSLAGASAI